MAKKSTKTKIVDSCCAPPIGEYKPRLYLDLEGKDVAQIKGLKIGEEGEFVVRGKIVSLEQRERQDEKGGKKMTGSINLEGYEVEVMGEEDNEFTKMSKDD